MCVKPNENDAISSTKDEEVTVIEVDRRQQSDPIRRVIMREASRICKICSSLKLFYQDARCCR